MGGAQASSMAPRSLGLSVAKVVVHGDNSDIYLFSSIHTGGGCRQALSLQPYLWAPIAA
eukprot:COSAG01_NODE_458_length_16743_cov_124.609208_19_plen_59_part_00